MSITPGPAPQAGDLLLACEHCAHSSLIAADHHLGAGRPTSDRLAETCLGVVRLCTRLADKLRDGNGGVLRFEVLQCIAACHAAAEAAREVGDRMIVSACLRCVRACTAWLDERDPS